MRTPTKSFRELVVWQKAHAFVLEVYVVTKRFPKDEIYVLIAQLRRAAISIPANIVEGYKKQGKADKLRFLNIAQGSIEECRYYLILAHDLGYCDSASLLLYLEEVSKLLEGYMRGIRSRN
jgi:four helix bundle protein